MAATWALRWAATGTRRLPDGLPTPSRLSTTGRLATTSRLATPWLPTGSTLSLPLRT